MVLFVKFFVSFVQSPSGDSEGVPHLDRLMGNRFFVVPPVLLLDSEARCLDLLERADLILVISPIVCWRVRLKGEFLLMNADYLLERFWLASNDTTGGMDADRQRENWGCFL